MVTVALFAACTPPEESWESTYTRLVAEMSETGSCPGLGLIDVGDRRIVDDFEFEAFVSHMRWGTDFYFGFDGSPAPCEAIVGDVPVNYGYVRGENEPLTTPGMSRVSAAEFHTVHGTWTRDDASVGWLCLESLSPPPPEQLYPIPGAAVGTWLVRYEDAVVFGSFTEATCIWVEDAGPIAHEDGGHSGYCNGEDDDRDGLIDEGAQDCNEDGVADCMQGIEEGGYCPP